MKPSEKRALLEKKRAEKEAEAQRRAEAKLAEREISDNQPRSESAEQESACAYSPGRMLKEKKPRRRRESFFSRHVMVITGVIASIVVRFGVIFGVDSLVRFVNVNKNAVYRDGVDIDIDSVYVLHDNCYDVRWKHLSGFNYEDHSYSKKGGKYIMKEYPIEGCDLVLKVGGPEDSDTPDFIYLIDYENGLRIDLFADDPRVFVEKNGYFTEEE